ncbi:glycosyltransferase family 4 protein [Nitrospira sp. Kam-Ns4a]
MLAEVSAAAVIGGAERVLREQALGLRARGHAVRLVARAPEGDPRPEVLVGDVPEYRYGVSRRSEPAFVLSSLGRSRQAFDRATDRRTVDAVVIHQSLAGLGALLHRRAQARAWIYVCHSLAHEEYRTRSQPGATALERARRVMNLRFRLWCERAVVRRCVPVLVLSRFMQERVVAVHGIAENRIRIVPGAADPARFQPPDDPVEVRRRLGLPPGKVLLFTVRNLVPRMGLEVLVRAVAALGPEGRDCLLLIGGEGPLRRTLEALVGELGLQDRVRLLGFVPEEALPGYYQAADLVVLPTQELEGFGLVTVEALACGTPVFGTPVGAIPEVLARVDPGLVAEGTDAEALAKGIRRLLCRFRDLPGEQARLSEKGRALVEAEYTWARHCERVEAILGEAVGKGQGSVAGLSTAGA